MCLIFFLAFLFLLFFFQIEPPPTAKELEEVQVGASRAPYFRNLGQGIKETSRSEQDCWMDLEPDEDPFLFVDLFDAAIAGDVITLQNMLQSKMDPNTLFSEETKWTPLHIASTFGMLGVVECLVEHKSDIDSRDANNTTPLMSASHLGHVAVVSLLIRAFADTNAVDTSGFAPLHHAADSEANNWQIIEELIQAKAELDGKSCKVIFFALNISQIPCSWRPLSMFPFLDCRLERQIHF